MYRSTTVVMFASLALACTAAVAVSAARPDSLLDTVLDRCSLGPGAINCLKSNVLEYLQDGRDGRTASDHATTADPRDMDAELMEATGAYIERQMSAGRAMDGGAAAAASAEAMAPQQPTTTTTARADMEMGMMQDKMLMPLMMLMKMKLKMLMPIMMAVVSMKATKALIISKVALILVIGFLVKEFLKKSGGIPGLPIHLPGFPGSEPSSTVAAPPMYGPPQSSGYESSSSWEPTGYSSHSSDSAHSMAYNSYLPSSSSSSSSSSGSSAGLSSTKYQ